MKNLTKILSATLASAMVLSSCIQDADIYLKDASLATEGNTSFVFNIVGDSDTATRGTVEDSGDYEQGDPDEYKVNSIQVYLFDATTGILESSFAMPGITTVDANDATSYTSGECEIEVGTYNVYAVANDTSDYVGITEAGFLDYVVEVADSVALQSTVPATGFVMTNRAAKNMGVIIEENTNNTIHIDLERVVVRIDVAQSLALFPLVNNGVQYATITLDEYKLVNLATSYYLYRHVADLTEFTEPAAYSLTSNFDEVSDNNGYVIDPFFFDKLYSDTTTVVSVVANNDYFTSALKDVTDDAGWRSMKGASETSTSYCFENTHYADAQLTGYTTGIVFKGVITPTTIIGETGTAPGYTAETIYYCDNAFYISIEELKKQLDGDIQIDGVSITESTSTEDLARINITRLVLEDGNYFCYYNYWIKHVDDKDDQNLNPMEFVVVRNNLYSLNVTSIAGMGTGTPDVTPYEPDETSQLLTVTSSVNDWIVREQGDGGDIGL